MTVAAMGLILLSGILFPGRAFEYNRRCHSEPWSEGRQSGKALPAELNVCEKITRALQRRGSGEPIGFRCSLTQPSKLKNQKTLFLTTGPPAVKPVLVEVESGARRAGFV